MNNDWEKRFRELFVGNGSIVCPIKGCGLAECGEVSVKEFICSLLSTQREELLRNTIRVLEKERDLLERDYATDGEYTDKELVEIQSKIIKKQWETFNSLLSQLQKK